MLIGLHILLQSINLIDRLNPWLKLTVSGILGSAFFVPFGLGFDYLFGLDDWTGVSHIRGGFSMALKESKGVILPATLTWIAINAPRVLQLNFREMDASASARSRIQDKKRLDVPQKFLSLIPSDIGSDIVYLRSELHYVRVVTPAGERLVLFSLKDAINEVESMVVGIRTHRSYWVSSQHIKALVTDSKYKYLLTSNNEKVPISRRKLSSVKDFVETHLAAVKSDCTLQISSPSHKTTRSVQA
jgi:hypothetical protein